jgi:transposase
MYAINVFMKMRVEYIRRPHKNKTYSYPFLVSSYRDEAGKSRRKIHQSLSHLPEHAVLALQSALRDGHQPEYVDINAIRFREATDFGDAWAAWRVAEDLGIIKQLEHLPEAHRLPIQAMIIDRVINPKPLSKRALAADYPGSGLSCILRDQVSPPLPVWYKSLESLAAHQKTIQQGLFCGGAKRVFLYDITSTYFEGKCCPLAAFGYNRDGKKGKLQIVVGLLCNHEGRPLAVRVFRGNTKDETTVLGQIQELKSDFGVEEMVFVGDRGMLTGKRLEDLQADDYDWLKTITALKRSDMMKLVEDEKHPLQLGLFDKKGLAEVVEGERRYILCHNPLRKDEDAAVRLRLLTKTEEKLQSLAGNVRDGRLKDKDKIARRLYRWINRWGMEKFFKVNYAEGKFEYSRREEEIERYAVLDGCYVIVTDVAASEMDKREVLERYKSLAQVEQAFRAMKSDDLMLRPIRHRLTGRVEGHVFMCMLAYLVTWEMRRRLVKLLQRHPKTRECEADSLREIWRELHQIKLGRIDAADKELTDISILTQQQITILKALGAQIKDTERISLGLCRQEKQHLKK